MDSATSYVLVVLGAGVAAGCATGRLKTSAFLVSIGAAIFLILKVAVNSYLVEALAFYAATASLGAWIGVEIRGAFGWLGRVLRAGDKHVKTSEATSVQADHLQQPEEIPFGAICCPHCGAASIDWWDKLMCGLIGRQCVCDRCGKSSREERKQRFVTSIAFLGSLWLILRIPHLAALLPVAATWIVLLFAVEWHYIYAIPLVPVVESERWKRTKDAFAWGFIGLIVATFVLTAVFNSL